MFQSFHIVWHHSHSYKCEHHICHQKLSDKDSHTKRKNISKKENTCPICEYQFSVNDLPKISFFSTYIPVFVCTYNEIAIQEQHKQVFLDKTPRAPPVHFS